MAHAIKVKLPTTTNRKTRTSASKPNTLTAVGICKAQAGPRRAMRLNTQTPIGQRVHFETSASKLLGRESTLKSWKLTETSSTSTWTWDSQKLNLACTPQTDTRKSDSNRAQQSMAGTGPWALKCWTSLVVTSVELDSVWAHLAKNMTQWHDGAAVIRLCSMRSSAVNEQTVELQTPMRQYV